ncbi:protein angel homolog 2 isoform X3 [Stegostoma tigrinum]|uniref:protein angel homolog 2 isoform X3 n=1 Tax=Stegostoma tigrinum TaxID=3053191 RepID=UPI0028700BD8|nr:protein angel homolog 2 isoform X3 [Stegostoma tigrinum]
MMVYFDYSHHMLTHHLQSFGRSCIVRSEIPQWFHRTSFFPCSRWPSSFAPETSSLHGFGNHFPFHWRPLCHRNPLLTFHSGSWTRGRSLHQAFSSYSINQSSGCSMEPVDSQPQAKRRKYDQTNQEEESITESENGSRATHENTGCVTFPGNEMGNSCVSNVIEDQETKYTKVGAVHRKWEDFTSLYKSSQGTSESKETSSGKQKEGFDFSVMSYNILAQDLLEDNSHLYKHCSQPLLQWGFRFPNILKELKQLDADILCLQEVQNNHYRQQLKPVLESLGYHCEYKMRTGNKRDGCAICFKRSKFSLISTCPVEFYRPKIQVLDRDNIGLVLLLQPVLSQSAALLCVANTHLLYNPRRGDIKLAQLAILLAEINKLASDGKGGYWPIILCGDFNAVPDSPLYNFIRNGKLIYDGLPMGKVSGQEQSHRGQRALTKPLWPPSLGISPACQYETLKCQQILKGAEKPSDTKDSYEESKDATSQKNSHLDEEISSAIQHNFRLMSVYSHYIAGTGKAEVTTCHSRSAVTVDYIFYSTTEHSTSANSGGAPHVGSLQLLGKLALLTEQDLWTVNRLPNENNSSDHLPLLAKFRHKL